MHLVDPVVQNFFAASPEFPKYFHLTYLPLSLTVHLEIKSSIESPELLFLSLPLSRLRSNDLTNSRDSDP